MSARLNLKPAQLRLINEIAAHGQMQLAAESCSMTQPAASRMLAEIEKHMGGKLFLRHPKGMEPTEIGNVVLRRSRVVLRELHDMANEVAAINTGLAGTARIGGVSGAAIGYIAPAIREIKQSSPAADIRIDVAPSHALLTGLVAGEFDFVLARILPEFDSDIFNILPMRDEKLCFMARSAHPLGRAPSVTLMEMSEYEWIMQERGAPIREATLAAYAGIGLPEPRSIISSTSLIFTIAYLAQSDSIAPMSEEVKRMLSEPPISAGFATLQVSHEIRVSPYYLLHLRRRPLSPLASRLRSLVIRHSQTTAIDLGKP